MLTNDVVSFEQPGPGFLSSPLAVSRAYSSCYNFSLVYVRCAWMLPSGFVQAVTCTFIHGFQNYLAQLFSLKSRKVI